MSTTGPWRAGAAAALLLGASLLVCPASTAAAEAPRSSPVLFKVDEARTGYLAEGPQPPLTLLWKFQTREGGGQIESYPTVDDGLSAASVAAGVVYVGGHDGWVYAIDARSGRKIWDFKTGGHVMSTPVLHDGRIYVGSMDGFFYALDAAKGTPVWKYESGYKLWNGLNYGGVRATPIVVGGKIFFGG